MLSEQVIFILVPCNDFAFFDFTAVKVFSFFCNCQSTFSAHLISKLLHPLQIFFRSMQFLSILIADRIRHQMAMNMVFILMDCH